MLLDFIWHLRGSTVLDGAAKDDEVLDAISQLLEKQHKTIIDRGPDFIAFDDPLWSDLGSPNWLAMVIYDRGRFWIEQGFSGRRLRYELRSLHGLVFCLFCAATAFFFGAVGGDLNQGLRFAALAFAWLYGMNIILALARVPWKIQRSVRAAQDRFPASRTLE
jgi:hypothetical protein